MVATTSCGDGETARLLVERLMADVVDLSLHSIGSYVVEACDVVHLRYIEWPLFLRILREPVSALNDLFSGHGG
jgi:hypothetical protein